MASPWRFCRYKITERDGLGSRKIPSPIRIDESAGPETRSADENKFVINNSRVFEGLTAIAK